MYRLFLLILLSLPSQQGTTSISPDGKFTLNVDVREEHDLQTRYITKLTDNISKKTVELANCIRRDLPEPTFYWSMDSRYLVFEHCNDSFADSRIKILNLLTGKIEFELTGLIGNKDNTQQQFDANNSILIYVDTSIANNRKTPHLNTFDLKTKKKKRILEFGLTRDMEFPTIQRVEGKRQINITHSDYITGQRITKLIEY